ncbi:hypothetical protein BC937DRAFT_92748 [Endogone sp. FLAS-F59071]|nr:hypothetical protein BC937DRAFT_92748 [Endogone sp. FLAS-F59071]|eukprot:RUS15209.1 hypothetical protein BC937DRAFT_92748 [Endogone sp. FLAS-F59071]
MQKKRKEREIEELEEVRPSFPSPSSTSPFFLSSTPQAKNSGLYHHTQKHLYAASSAATKLGGTKFRRDRGLGMGIGKFKGGMLTLSKRDIARIRIMYIGSNECAIAKPLERFECQVERTFVIFGTRNVFCETKPILEPSSVAVLEFAYYHKMQLLLGRAIRAMLHFIYFSFRSIN